MSYKKIYVRNNWDATWLHIQHANFRYSYSIEQLASRFTFDVKPETNRLTETLTTNKFRMYSEVKVEEYYDDDVTFKVRAHGFIVNAEGTRGGLGIACTDPLGLLEKQRVNVPVQSADIVKIGNEATPVVFRKIVELGEDRWVPDVADPAYNTLHVGNNPANDRRTWKGIGRVKDTGALDTDPLDGTPWFPDKVIPPGRYTIGSDLFNYLEFTSYTPEPDPPDHITVDFVMAYVEGTNELEDVILALLTRTLAQSGLGLIAGVHYVTAGAGQTIWPSGITVNEWKWREEDGTAMEALENLLSTFAPPNYRPRWNHATQQLWIGFEAQDNVTYIALNEVAYDRAVVREERPFYSQITVAGINEHPQNELANATHIDVLDSEWPAGWSLDTLNGDTASIMDFDMGTFLRIWYDHNNSPPAADLKYWPTLHIRWADSIPIERIRFWMLNSRRDFPFGIRFEGHNDPAYDTYDPLAPWQPLHEELYDQEYKPYEEVDKNGNFMLLECRRMLISMKPAKIHLRFRYAAGLTDLEIIKRNTVLGRAYIIEGFPEGQWTQIVGTEADDGAYTLKMDSLAKQILSRAVDANKLVVGHRTAHFTNNSLSNTNQCALEAARILLETIREQRTCGLRTPSDPDLDVGVTVKFKEPYWNITKKAMIETIEVTDTEVVIDGTSYGFSDALPAAAWTGEDPDAL